MYSRTKGAYRQGNSLSVHGYWLHTRAHHTHGLVQERRNRSALAMELRLFCINPSICVMAMIWMITCPVVVSATNWKIEHNRFFSTVTRSPNGLQWFDLTYWGLDKFLIFYRRNALPCMKMCQFWFKFYWRYIAWWDELKGRHCFW